jgi:hypothetical protein
MKKFFIVGCPRSGTTVLQQALNRHSQIAVPPETSFLFLLGFPRRDQKAHWARLTRDLGIDLPFPAAGIRSEHAARALYERVAVLYLQRLGRTGVTYFGEKSPEHQLRLAQILRLFPGAKVLLIYRDGRDVALSLAGVPWMFSDLYLSFALWLHYYKVQKEACGWNSPDLYVVRYEDLATDPRGQLKAVLDFLGLAYEPLVAEGRGSREAIADRELPWKGRSLEEISARGIGAWRTQLTPGQIRTLECWGGDALQSLGYELVTEPGGRLPYWFFPVLSARALRWLLREGRYKVWKEAGRQGLRLGLDWARQHLPGRSPARLARPSTG